MWRTWSVFLILTVAFWPNQTRADMTMVTVGTNSQHSSAQLELVRHHQFLAGYVDDHSGLAVGFGRCFETKHLPFDFAGAQGSMSGNQYCLVPLVTVERLSTTGQLSVQPMLRAQWSLDNKQPFTASRYMPNLIEFELGPVFTARQPMVVRTLYRIGLSSGHHPARGFGIEYRQEFRPSNDLSDVEFVDPKKPNYFNQYRGKKHPYDVVGSQHLFGSWDAPGGMIRLKAHMGFINRFINTGRLDNFVWQLDYVWRRYK